jgi:GNAT superfamily N-acetyltransferase
MKTVEIKKVDMHSIQDLLDLIEEFTKEFVSVENCNHVRTQYSNYMQSTELLSFVLYVNKKPIGCIQLFYYQHPPMLDTDMYLEGEMLNFYIIRSERNSGYGQKLLDVFMQEAKNLGIRYIRLNSSPDAESIYMRNGFKKPPFSYMGIWLK